MPDMVDMLQALPHAVTPGPAGPDLAAADVARGHRALRQRRRRRLAGVAGTVAVGAAAVVFVAMVATVLFTIPLYPGFPGVGLDISWEYGLNEAVARHLAHRIDCHRGPHRANH